MHAGAWIAAYLAALVIWSIVLLAGKTPTLWQGSSVLFLNGAFIVASVATMVIRRVSPDSALIGFEIVMAALILVLRPVRLALHVSLGDLERVLEDCFKRTRTNYVRDGGEYVLTVAQSEMRVSLNTTFLGATRIRFGGNTESRKARLIRTLIGKQFRGSFPALKMRA